MYRSRLQKRPAKSMTKRAYFVVGVARIELATPAMSTQCLGHIKPDYRHLAFPGHGTGRERVVNRGEFHRSFTGAPARLSAGGAAHG